MNAQWFALIGMVHGSVGAAVLALLALAVWFQRGGDDASFGASLVFASMLQLVQVVLGLAQRATYDQHLRALVVNRMPTLAWWLQRKEHLALGAACLVWAALASWWVGKRWAGASWGKAFSRAAVLSARLAAVMALVVFTLGSIVAVGIDHVISP